MLLDVRAVEKFDPVIGLPEMSLLFAASTYLHCESVLLHLRVYVVPPIVLVFSMFLLIFSISARKSPEAFFNFSLGPSPFTDFETLINSDAFPPALLLSVICFDIFDNLSYASSASFTLS